MRADGVVDLPSKASVAETVTRLESLLRSKGIKIFARIDQAREAEAVGLAMPETVLVVFGDPRAGTPAMRASPSLAIDLPLKALVGRDEGGRVWLSYNDPEYLRARHHLDMAPFQQVPSLLEAAVK